MTIANTVYRHGEGLPLVLVHAFPVDHRMWDRCAASLIAQADRAGMAPFPVYAPDMPGAGDCPLPGPASSGPADSDGALPGALDAMAQAFVDMIAATGAQKAIWVGLSMGGYLVEAVARLYPQTVAGLALCDTTMMADRPASRANRLQIARTCEVEGTLDPVMHFARPQEGDSTVKRSPAFVQTMTEWIQSQDPRGIAWRERMAAGRPDQSGLAGSIRVPVALVSGRCDPSSPPRTMEPLAQAMRRAGTDVTFTAIDDCGHFSAVEHPDQVAAALLDLVDRVRRQA